MTLDLSTPRPAPDKEADDSLLWLGNGGGEMGRLVRELDWSQNPLGAPAQWPQSLRTAVSICLQSRFPMLIWWGEARVMIYNDAYRPMLGDKHPRSLGQAGRESWGEIWHIIGPMLEGVMERAEATWSEDQMLSVTRYGFVEETYFTYSYSPIREETGGVGGVFCAVTETTARVIGARRLNTLRQLSGATKQADAMAACAEASRLLGSNPDDVPFVVMYLADDDRKIARLAGRAGIEPSDPLAAATIEIGASTSAVAEVLRTGAAVTVSGLTLPAAHTALALPVANSTGAVLLGTSARRPLDADYRTFLQLVADHVSTVVGAARAYQAERRRAEALAEIDRAKTVFFSNVSHEFRTPLTLMLGPLEHAMEQSTSLRSTLELAHRNSLRLLKLVNSLLEFSRIEAGRLEASFEPVDLAAITTELASQFRAAVEQAGLRLVVDCAPLSHAAYVDPDLWEKIIFNLLSNAVKFTFEGAITVTLREVPTSTFLVQKARAANSPARPAPEGAVVLSVRDTGVGIPPAELSRVFERFHRVRDTRARSHEGSGIGLALVHDLVRMHGGFVEVRSALGEGTEFTIMLPLGREHLAEERVGVAERRSRNGNSASPYVNEALSWINDRADAAPLITADAGESLPTASRRAPPPHAGARVLLVDDNADMRGYVRRLLSDEGYRVDTARDGDSALARIKAQPPRLIVTDVMMPGLDGFGLLKALRADDALRTIPVILLTARAGEEARIEGATAGANDYLTKPFAARELLARVETQLEIADVRDRAASLIESERHRLHQLLMRAPVSICLLGGPKHVFLLANERYMALIGRRDPSEILGRTLQDALPEIVPQGYLDILDRVYRDAQRFVGEEMRVELKVPGDGAKQVFLNFIYEPTRDSDGKVDGVLVLAVDVTGQVAARREVEQLARVAEAERDRARASEQHLRAVIDTTPECVMLVRRDGVVLDINASGIAMMEAGAKDEVVGRRLYPFIAPEDRARAQAFNEAVCGGKKGLLEFDLVGRNGTRRHIETHASPLEQDGEFAHLSLARDITARKRAEAGLRQSEERFRAIVTASSDSAYRMNADWSEMLEIDGEDLLASQQPAARSWITKYIPAEDHAMVLDHIRTAIAGRTLFEFEHRVILADGRIGWTHSRAVPLFNAAGELTEWFGIASDITARITAAEALRQLNEKVEQERRLYDTVLSNTPDLVYVFNLQCQFIYANAALLAVWGRTAEEARNKRCRELGYDAWQAERHEREVATVVATRQPLRGEVPFAGANGRRIYDYIVVPVFGTDGRVEAVAGTARDITDRKHKEDVQRFLFDLNAATQQLADPDEIMATTARMLGEHLDVSRCAYASIEQEQVFVITGDHSRGVSSIVGRWPVAAFGAECTRLMLANEAYVITDSEADPRIGPDDLPAYRATAIRAVICVPLHKLGKFTAAMAVHQATPRAWTSEEIELVKLVVGRCWESLERAQSVRRLRASEQRLRFMAESMPQKIFTAKATGELDYVNPQWIEFTGQPAEQLLDWGWLDYVHPEDRAAALAAWRRGLEAAVDVQTEHRFRRHDGTFRWHLTRARPMRDGAGRTVMWIGSNTDIQDRKRAEAKLEWIVADRTAKLRETIAELESFSYSIAHDMRAPLRSLQGFSELLLQDHSAGLDAEGQGFLRRIATAAGRMDKLIQDVLNYSRIVRGELPLEPVDVAALVRSIVETYPPLASEHADIELKGDFPAVLGNEAMLTQVLSNLLGNAVKFVAPGERPRVSVSAAATSTRVTFSIRDNGIGIPESQHAKIFEIFQQAAIGYGGTGIGLAIVRKAVERMGGRVGVESAPGAGSTFWFEMPRAGKA